MTTVDEIIAAIDEGTSLLEQAQARFARTAHDSRALSSALSKLDADATADQASRVTSKLDEINRCITTTTTLAGQAHRSATTLKGDLTADTVGRARALPAAATHAPYVAHPTRLVTLPVGKFDYLLGQITSGQHNTDRSRQMKRQFARIGIHDNTEGRQILQAHFTDTAARDDNVVETFTGDYGTFEVRDSLLCGPGGFLHCESTWEVDGDRRRLTTVIPRGGRL